MVIVQQTIPNALYAIHVNNHERRYKSTFTIKESAANWCGTLGLGSSEVTRLDNQSTLPDHGLPGQFPSV